MTENGELGGGVMRENGGSEHHQPEYMNTGNRQD